MTKDSKNNSKQQAQQSIPEDSNVADLEAQQAEAERQNRIDRMIRSRETAFLEEERTLHQWKAPARTFRKRSNEYFTTIGAIVLLVCIILLFIREFLLMMVVIAFSFLAYVLASVEPDDVEVSITSRGFRVDGKFYRWDVLGRYWFSKDADKDLLTVETFLNFPRQLIFVIDKKDQNKIRDLLSPYVLHEKPEDSFVDKASSWLKEKMPLEG